MNWISALSPMQWLLMMAIPPAVLSLYFLKLKRRELVVPSTLLWKKAMEDIHVNSFGMLATRLEWTEPRR